MSNSKRVKSIKALKHYKRYGSAMIASVLALSGTLFLGDTAQAINPKNTAQGVRHSSSSNTGAGTGSRLGLTTQQRRLSTQIKSNIPYIDDLPDLPPVTPVTQAVLDKLEKIHVVPKTTVSKQDLDVREVGEQIIYWYTQDSVSILDLGD